MIRKAKIYGIAINTTNLFYLAQFTLFCQENFRFFEKIKIDGAWQLVIKS